MDCAVMLNGTKCNEASGLRAKTHSQIGQFESSVDGSSEVHKKKKIMKLRME